MQDELDDVYEEIELIADTVEKMACYPNALKENDFLNVVTRLARTIGRISVIEYQWQQANKK
jgi:hypothetical protein